MSTDLTQQVGKLEALLDKIQFNADALRTLRKAGGTAPALATAAPAATAPTAAAAPVPSEAPVAAAPMVNVPNGGTLEPKPFIPEPFIPEPLIPKPYVAEPSPQAWNSFSASRQEETEPILLVRRVVSEPPVVTAIATPSAANLHGEEFDLSAPEPEIPVLEPEITTVEIEAEAEALELSSPQITEVEPPDSVDERPPLIVMEAEPSSSDRRAALNLELPKAPGVPFMEPMREGDSIEAPPLPPMELEVIDLETAGEELTTIPPSAPSAADVPPEPPPLRMDAEFGAHRPEPEQVEADFSLSVPPPLDEIEAPPISTEQERDESDGLGVSLGFSPQAVSPHSEDDDDVHRSPRTPPPESGPQVSLTPKDADPARLDVQTPSTPDYRGDRGDGPTMEQLGSTISFAAEDRSSRELELAEGAKAAPAAAESDFEAEIPRVGFSGGYDASLSSPATARQELEAHDREERQRAERRSFVPGSGPVVAETAVPAPLAVGPDASIARAPVNLSAPSAIYDSTRAADAPGSFLDRLEASLALAAHE